MRTVEIEIKNEIALRFLQNLESLNIIRVIRQKTSSTKQKLSKRFSGCISKEKADMLENELLQMRSEWERNIS